MKYSTILTQKELEIFTKRLMRKYNRKRRINEKFLLKEKTPLRKALMVFCNVLCWLIIAVCVLICGNVIISKVNNIPPSYLGYSTMKIASGSMRASGFEIGDCVTVHTVDTKTLKPGDIIAFYVYTPSYSQYSYHTTHKLSIAPETQPQLKFLPEQIIGLNTKEIMDASKSKATLVFHEIQEVWEDENGTRWFFNKGSSNATMDMWQIDEHYVLGVYIDTPIATWFASKVGTASTSTMLLKILIIPILITVLYVILTSIRRVGCLLLELDCIEEKRKITDPICVRNKIGLKMSKRDKYKILATAENDDERAEYIKLLWKDGDAPISIKKYYIRKRLMLKPLERLRDINRNCEQMIKDNKSSTYIVKYYVRERAKIQDELATLSKKLKK